MTQDEYTNQRWGGDMRAIYHDVVYDIDSCYFPEFLVGLNDGSDEIFWVRCENIELVK